MNRPECVPPPSWTSCFNVDCADAVVKRFTDKGGQMLMRPRQVPGGGWIVQDTDSRGARLAVVGPVK